MTMPRPSIRTRTPGCVSLVTSTMSHNLKVVKAALSVTRPRSPMTLPDAMSLKQVFLWDGWWGSGVGAEIAVHVLSASEEVVAVVEAEPTVVAAAVAVAG